MATRTSVLATQSLMGLGATETTEPRKWSERLSNPLLLANLLLAPIVGRGDTGSGHHERPLVGHAMGTAWFPSNFSLLPFLTLSVGRQERFIVRVVGSSNGRKAYIYRPKGGLKDQKPSCHVANHGRPQPMSDARIGSGKSRPS